MLLLGCSVQLLSPWFRNRACVGSAPSRAPAHLAQLLRSQEHSLWGGPASQGAQGGFGAGGAAGPQPGARGSSGVWSCPGWLCRTDLAMSNILSSPWQHRAPIPDVSGVASRMDRAQEGLCSLPSAGSGALQSDGTGILYSPRSPSPVLTSSSPWLDACTPLPPFFTDPGALILLVPFLQGSEQEPSPSSPIQPSQPLFL